MYILTPLLLPLRKGESAEGSENRAQRYYFLRTQQNKMHKIDVFVHKLIDLCNKEDGKCLVFTKICRIFAPILYF
mgnify:CR=1 FL=1